MAEILLHTYELSPFGQIIRLALAHKGLDWKFVDQPMICPKPELSVLTGGYERIPVLQIGADIYCDTAMIAMVLEEQKPTPSLYPEPLGLGGRLIAQWAGGPWFTPVVGASLGANPDAVPQEFWDDREKRFGMKREAFLPMVPHLQSQFHGGVELVKDALSDGRAFFAGEAAGHADFALFANFQFVGVGGIRPTDFGSVIASWYDRVEAIGDGNRENWSADQAIEHAGSIEPSGEYGVAEDSGFMAGQTVSVTTESPDPAAVTGTLLGLDHRHIVVERQDERAGTLHVHFPRIGQVVIPA